MAHTVFLSIALTTLTENRLPEHFISQLDVRPKLACVLPMPTDPEIEQILTGLTNVLPYAPIEQILTGLTSVPTYTPKKQIFTGLTSI